MITKSSAAGFNDASLFITSSEYIIPVGFAYFGTHQIPFTSGSLTASSTASISGPSEFKGMVISSAPNA